MKPEGWARYLGTVNGKTLVHVHYYQVGFPPQVSFWSIEGLLGLHDFPTLPSDLVEIDRSPQLAGIVFPH